MNARNATTIRVGQDFNRPYPPLICVTPGKPSEIVPEPIITHTLQLRGVSVDAIHEAMANSLRQEGWTVLTPAETASAAELQCRDSGETPGQFAARIGIARMTLSRAWRNPNCPPCRYELGPLGRRVMRFWPTPTFEAWILRNKKP